MKSLPVGERRSPHFIDGGHALDDLLHTVLAERTHALRYRALLDLILVQAVEHHASHPAVELEHLEYRGAAVVSSLLARQAASPAREGMAGERRGILTEHGERFGLG